MMVALFIGQRFVVVHLFKHPEGMSGTLLCKSHNFTWVGGAASVFTLLAIAFERYYAVVYPYGNKGKLTFEKLKVFEVMKQDSTLVFLGERGHSEVNFPNCLSEFERSPYEFRLWIVRPQYTSCTS